MTNLNALLLISTACPHCASVLQGLSELVKSGIITKLNVINISNDPAIAEQYGVRAVPYLRLQDFEFNGLLSLSEMKYWAEQAQQKDGVANYFNQSLKSGGLNKVLNLLKQDASKFSAILTLLQDPQTELAVRVGIGAVFEEFEGSDVLLGYIDDMIELAHHPDARVRIDVCHYLALTHSASVLPTIESLLKDENAEVREVANESVEVLQHV